MGECPGVRDKLLRELLERWIIVHNHLAEAGERGVGLVLAHLVGGVKQPEHGLPVVHAGQEDHELDVDGDQLQVQRGHVEVDRDVQRDLARVNSGQKLVDMVLEVEEVHEGVVVEGE